MTLVEEQALDDDAPEELESLSFDGQELELQTDWKLELQAS